jgi:signal recognition particle subunit SRP54
VGMFKDAGKMRVDEKELIRLEAIVDSMTPRERRHHEIINGKRRKRIAKGSGTSVQQVNQLLRQYVQSSKMMKSVSKSFWGKQLGKLNAGVGAGG